MSSDAAISLPASALQPRAVVAQPRTSARARQGSRRRLAAGLFLIANITLFIRPGDLFAALEGAPIYEAAVLLCLALSIPDLVRLITRRRLIETPVMVCVLLMLPAVVLSHLSHLSLRAASYSAVEFAKLVVYFMLFVAVVDSMSRLQWFLRWLLRLIVVATVLALLAYFEVINLATLTALDHRERDEAGGILGVVRRLRGAGIFNDPNDLCLILSIGAAIALYRLNKRDSGGWVGQLGALVSLAVLIVALVLTRSRGGLLALLATVGAFCVSRFGWRRSMLLALLAIPFLPLAMAGRQTSINLAEDTAQARIQLWSDGIEFFRAAPVFGIGFGMFAEESSDVAHNSFLHCYSELGAIGGTLFFGAFFIALDGLRRLRAGALLSMTNDIARLRPCVFGIVAGYAVGIFALSRAYVVPTYLVFGVTAGYLQLARAQGAHPVLTLNRRLLTRVSVASAMCLLAIYLLVKVFARFG